MHTALYRDIQDRIQAAQHILLLTDERIDGDTTGSILGLYHVLQDLGKKVEIFSPKPLPNYLKFIPGTESIQRDAKVFQQTSIDLAIICDCSDGEYIKAHLPTMPRPVPLIVFDHHATNPLYGTINVVERTAASTADVVWRFIKSTTWQVSPSAAQSILTGICTDTVLFSTTNTTTSALDASAELVKFGADLKVIVKNTLMNQSLGSLKLWGVAMERLAVDPDLQATVTAITQQDIITAQASEDDASGISGLLHALLNEQHEVVIVYRETSDGAVKGSIRSRGRDISKLAEKFGGGGHKLAAGFKVPNVKLTSQNGFWSIDKNQTS